MTLRGGLGSRHETVVDDEGGTIRAFPTIKPRLVSREDKSHINTLLDTETPSEDEIMARAKTKTVTESIEDVKKVEEKLAEETKVDMPVVTVEAVKAAIETERKAAIETERKRGIVENIQAFSGWTTFGIVAAASLLTLTVLGPVGGFIVFVTMYFIATPMSKLISTALTKMVSASVWLMAVAGGGTVITAGWLFLNGAVVPALGCTIIAVMGLMILVLKNEIEKEPNRRAVEQANAIAVVEIRKD